jgi:GDPmannose 4,6-dehydratase
MKTAFICGVSGQDGAYLSRLLLDKGYRVIGASRDAAASGFGNLKKLGVFEKIETVTVAPADYDSVRHALEVAAPDEVYNLSGQSSVGLSFQKPAETLESISVGNLNFLEAIRVIGRPVRFYNACSSECFGDITEAADETTPFRPRSPYAVAKSAAFWQVANYREAYGLFAASGILFNHDSPLRPESFVTRKIVAAATRIAAGNSETLGLGNISVQRDWGWAPEYVEAMWAMLQQDEADDYVVATGETQALESFLAAAFEYAGLDWHDHVETDETLTRPADLRVSRANPAKARDKLGWQATHRMADVVAMMMDADRESLRDG